MRLLKRVSMVATALAMVVFASAATMARGYSPAPTSHSYSGSWPVTVTGTQTNFTGCLTLTAGGSASFVSGSERYSGSFLITNNLLVATIGVEGYGQNAGLLFMGPARHGSLDPGVFEDVYGGADFNSGALTFGTKGGC